LIQLKVSETEIQ